MKQFFKTILFALLVAIFSVPALIAAPENHEEFAKNYMPETQAVFERFRKECNETKALRMELAENLRIMNRELDDDAAHCALMAKIKALEAQEAEWVKLVKDCYFKHKGNLLSIDQLSEINAKTAKAKIEWEKNSLKPFLQNFVKNFGILDMVKIPGQNYYIAKYEVTQKEYEAIMKENPSRFKGENLPVECVSWHDAMKFCEKLNIRAAGRLPVGYKYSLPTSEQWEIACRAGTKTRFCSGDSESDLQKVAWYSRNADETHPVGTKEPNAWGIYDMHGNVWEWVLDVHLNYRSERGFRGGSWNNSAGRCESSDFLSNGPDARFDSLGFRVALVPAGQ